MLLETADSNITNLRHVTGPYPMPVQLCPQHNYLSEYTYSFKMCTVIVLLITMKKCIKMLLLVDF
jgi:hypothetical protein